MRIAELLFVDSGDDVNALGGEYGNALQAAASKGNEAVARLLVGNGADVNAQSGEYGNASRRRHQRATGRWPVHLRTARLMSTPKATFSATQSRRRHREVTRRWTVCLWAPGLINSYSDDPFL